MTNLHPHKGSLVYELLRIFNSPSVSGGAVVEIWRVKVKRRTTTRSKAPYDFTMSIKVSQHP